MEKSRSRTVVSLVLEMFEHVIGCDVAYLSKINLSKGKQIACGLVNAVMLGLLTVALALSSWWCILAVVFVYLQSLKLALVAILLMLVALNLVVLLSAVLWLRQLRKTLSGAES